MSSGLYEELTSSGLLIRHEEVKMAGQGNNSWKVIKPEQIPFVDAVLATVCGVGSDAFDEDSFCLILLRMAIWNDKRCSSSYS